MAKKKWAAGAAVLVAAVGGYATADAFDKVPGVLTLDQGNTPKAVVVGGKRYEPLHKPAAAPSLAAPVHGAAPSKQSVKQAVDAALKNSGFGDTTAVIVRDADTGAVLDDHDASKATTPASVTKLVSSFAISHSKLAENSSLRTRAMLDGSTLTLVGGGDMVLDEGMGDASKIAGYAGLEDLAQQAAAQLKKKNLTSVTLDTNTSYASGPATAKGWDESMLSSGYTARISTLALASDRADNKTPAAADPTKNAADAFAKALRKHGIHATYGKNTTQVPHGTSVGQVDSAPVLDLVGLALQDSDNSMIESLTRQAAASEGVHGDSTAIGAWVVSKLKSQGVDTTGVHLADTSGLSDGTTLPVRVLGEVLVRGTSGKDSRFGAVLSRLPVSGWNGTLHDRYQGDLTKPGAGLVRAKTGSLTGVSSLAGELRTVGNHRLVFAVTTNGSFSGGPDGARGAIDQLVTGLTKLR